MSGARVEASVSDVGAVLRGSFAQNRARVLLAVLAIALGVALGLAVQLINRTAVDELTQGVRTIAGDADLTVRGARSGFSERVFAQLARDPDVAVASPIVEVDVRVAGRPEPLRVLGLDLFRAAAIQPALFPEGGERYDALRSDTIFLSNAAQAWLGLERGATLVLQSGLADIPLRVAGRLPGAGGQRLAVMDIAGARRHWAARAASRASTCALPPASTWPRSARGSRARCRLALRSTARRRASPRPRLCRARTA